MNPQFDHEKLRAYQDALKFVGCIGPILENLPGKLAAREQLDRASTSIVLNIAEGNGKRSRPDRCRYFDIARGSILECAACLDVLIIRKKITAEEASLGKEMLLGVVAMVSGLIARFSGELNEAEEAYGVLNPDSKFENEKD